MGGWSSITVKAFVFCKMLFFFFHCLSIACSLYGERLQLSQNKHFVLDTTQRYLFCQFVNTAQNFAVFSNYSHCSVNLVSAESNGLLGKEKVVSERF